jgi:hypothetical protein
MAKRQSPDCIICGRKSYTQSFCSGHWNRIRSTGSPQANIPLRKSRAGARNGMWRGGVVKCSDGRIAIYSPGHPFPNFNKLYVYRYRLIMEAHLGRYLLPDELVHHKNGNCSDDRIENLQIMSRSQHTKKHVKKMLARRKIAAGY